MRLANAAIGNTSAATSTNRDKLRVAIIVLSEFLPVYPRRNTSGLVEGA